MATVHEENSAAADDPSPGQRLRAAREAMGCSREEMAKRLNLRLSQVAALEEDRYQALPGNTFTLGYLRSYARAVKLDETALLKRYRVLCASAPGASAPAVPPRRRPISLETQGHRRHWGAAAALVLVVALWGWQRDGSQVAEMLPLTADADLVSMALPGGLDEAMPFGVNPLDSVELLPVTPVAESVVAAATSDVASTGAPVPAELAVDRLNLHFSADCWVEIKDRDNKVLVAMLKRADEQLQIEGRGPFKVLLGFAPGVEMAYNGRPVDIDVPNGARAARLIVGSS